MQKQFPVSGLENKRRVRGKRAPAAKILPHNREVTCKSDGRTHSLARQHEGRCVVSTSYDQKEEPPQIGCENLAKIT